MSTPMKRAALAVSLLLGSAYSHAFTPAVVYDPSGKFDKSFNEAAYTGAERFKKNTGIAYREAQVANDAQKEQVLRNLARRNVDLVIAIGFSFTQAVQTVAAEFPNVKFAIVDDVAKGANIQSVVFREQEGAYLVGMAASMASKSKKVGFIGGMDVPLIRAFQCGYAQGAKAADAKTEVIANMTGTTPQAFNDPARGGELARSQFDRGVDVVFHAAGGTGMGVLQAAKDKNKLGIGVDSNQNHLFPGFVLTSMIKRVDNAVYKLMDDARTKKWKPGVVSMGLKEGGMDWAVDANNRKLVSAGMETRVGQAKKDIISGKIKVVDYRAGMSCPVK